ncbi:acyltransferase domain-containing protein [Streptomyces liangshanensis]|uniref:[acyl-carrier-protein] S-malonyltransferase n=1 Tax=Streptomyces liangshanensis TaxID=2717324 RepID=A0A6G9GZK2_9ACTN|nr:acyltransferase domain-containing protein [Streptomyces liangshanensis]QIQ03391.1 acyltransferase domain-containing protein [Streptomyces liangshanensis]
MPASSRDTVPRATLHLFPGQGDFALTPLVKGLRAHRPLRDAVTGVFEDIDRVAVEHGLAPLGPRLVSDAPPSGRELAEGPPGTAQLALFGASLSVHRALCAAGQAPERLLAVSFGEIPALVAACCFTVADGARIALRLGQLLHHCPGGLTLLGAGEEAAHALLRTAGVALGPARARVVVGCVNDSRETVLAGPLPALERVERLARARALPATRLRLPFLSHHPSLGRTATAFAAFVRTLPARPPRLPVHSAVAQGVHGPGTDLPAALAHCLTRPARLPGTLRRAAPGPVLLLEAGTGGALTRNARHILPGALARAPLVDPDFRWSAPPVPVSHPGAVG